MNRWLFGVMLIVLAAVSGCAKGSQLPTTAAGGKKIEILLLSQRGNPAEMNERQYQYRVEVGQWMESDLLNLLRRAGYEAHQISERSAFAPKAGSYLLEVTIVSYNPGSSAARMVVGFGAGAAALDNSYVLYGEQQKPLLTWSDGVGTSQHWTRLPRTLNGRAVKKVSEYLRSK